MYTIRKTIESMEGMCVKKIEWTWCPFFIRYSTESPPPSYIPSSLKMQTMKMTHHEVYGCIVFSTHGRVLIAQGRKTGKWSFPKGHKNVDEPQLDCARRETFEETGISLGEEYSKKLKLGFGEYFIYHLEDEPSLTIHDNVEIMDLRWVALEDLHNFDTNRSLRIYIRRHMAK